MYESLYLEKVESYKEEMSLLFLYDEGKYEKAYEKGDQTVELVSEPKMFKGICSRIINSSTISYFLEFFRIGK